LQDDPEDIARLDREIARLFRPGLRATDNPNSYATRAGIYRFDGEARRAWDTRLEQISVRRRQSMKVTSGDAIDPQIVIYTHGVCRPIDPTGWGIIAWKAYLPNGTDPVAEFSAVSGKGRDTIWSAYEATIHALRWAWRQGITRVLIKCSSFDAVAQIADIWSVNSPVLVAQRTVISMARRSLVALAVEHCPARDMPEVTKLADRAYSKVEVTS